MVDVNLDIRQFADEVPSGPVPAGRYVCQVSGSIIKDTSSGGRMIVVDFQIDEGQFRGRHVFENLNLWHSNPTVSEIAKKQLANIAKSCGFNDVLRRTEELNGRRLALQIEVDGSYNVVKRHYAMTAVPGGISNRQTAPPTNPPGIVPPPTPPAVSPQNLTGQNQSLGGNPPWV